MGKAVFTVPSSVLSASTTARMRSARYSPSPLDHGRVVLGPHVGLGRQFKDKHLPPEIAVSHGRRLLGVTDPDEGDDPVRLVEVGRTEHDLDTGKPVVGSEHGEEGRPGSA